MCVALEALHQAEEGRVGVENLQKKAQSLFCISPFCQPELVQLQSLFPSPLSDVLSTK